MADEKRDVRPFKEWNISYVPDVIISPDNRTVINLGETYVVCWLVVMEATTERGHVGYTKRVIAGRSMWSNKKYTVHFVCPGDKSEASVRKFVSGMCDPKES